MEFKESVAMESRKPAYVVFVDDEPSVRDTVRKTLERVGMNVECFHGVDDCLTYLASGRCDLLVTDVKINTDKIKNT